MNSKNIQKAVNTATKEKELYKAVFSQMHTSVDVKLEDYQTMKRPIHRQIGKRVFMIAAVICILSALSIGAYAIYQYSLRDLALPEAGDGYVPSISISDSHETDDADNAASETTQNDPTPDPFEYEVTMISLQGYIDSPEYKAMAKWREFTEGYDPDGTLLNKADAIRKEQLRTTGVMSIPGLDDHYWMHYHAYTQEMADKLDEIAGEYNLGLHREFLIFDDKDKFIEHIAHGDFLGEGCNIYPGYAFDSGTFQFSGSIYGGQFGALDLADIGGNKLSGLDTWLTLNGIETELILYNPKNLENPEYSLVGEWLPQELIVFVPYESIEENGEGIFIFDNTSGEPVLMTLREYGGDIGDIVIHYNIGFQMRSCKKGTLDVVSLNVENLSDYTEWAYNTACGVIAGLSQSPYMSLIIVDTDDAFITVNVLEGSDVIEATKLEALADAIDFTLLK